MNRLPSLLSFLLLWTLTPSTSAQSIPLYFKKLNTGNGLSHNKVNAILQDQRGFIWIGTEDGLNRYDGNDFLIFRATPGQINGLSGNIIQALYEDKSGVLWIGTADGGLSRYDYRQPPAQQFRQYKYNPDDASSIPVNTINAIVEDRQGMLWLATSGSIVVRFNPREETFEVPVTRGRRTALALALDQTDTLWVGRQGGGILKIDTRTLQSVTDPRYDDLYADLPHVVVTALHEDRDQHMWFGSWDKVLYCYQPQHRAEIIFSHQDKPHSFIEDEINAIAEDARGRLWFGGRERGLQMLDKTTGHFYSFRSSPTLAGTLADDRVNCIFPDQSGHIWVGTNKGISTAHVSPQFIQQFLPETEQSGRPHVTVHDFFKDPQGTLWIGTSQGLYLLQNGTYHPEHVPLYYNDQLLAITHFFQDGDGTMYIGTNYSLFRYDPTRRKVNLLPNTDQDQVMNKLIESRIVSIIRDTINSHPVLLTSPYGHYLAYYDLHDQRWVSRTDSIARIVERFNLQDNLIRRFYRDGSGQIWLAMTTKGLGLWTKKDVPFIEYYSHHPAVETSITHNNVYDLTEDDSGGFWVTTYGGGLQYFDPARSAFRHIKASGNLLEGIQRDGQGRLWMIGGGNLHRYDPRDSAYVSFDLPDLQDAGGIRGRIYQDDEGQLYVSGPNYYIRFHPDEVAPDEVGADVLFTDFRIFNQSYSHLLFEKEISLRYNQNYFTIEYAAPHYPGTEKVIYRYRLEGVDDDWIQAGNRNSVSYPNTGSGRFVFRVQASTDAGRWTDQTASLVITVIPPVWKRWWFLVLVALLVASIITAVQRYRIRELLKRQAMRNRIAQDLHDNIGSTLSSISVYSQVARIRHEKQDDEQLEELLEKIGTTSNAMISDMNDIVWAINPRNDSMDKIIQRMESFARPLLAARHIQLEMSYAPEVLQVNLDMEKRKNLYLIFKEAIHNAFKYSGCSVIRVALELQRDLLHMEIADNGIGFVVPQEGEGIKGSLSGNGLENIRSRVAELGGRVRIHSIPGEGTTIGVSFNIP